MTRRDRRGFYRRAVRSAWPRPSTVLGWAALVVLAALVVMLLIGDRPR